MDDGLKIRQKSILGSLIVIRCLRLSFDHAKSCHQNQLFTDKSTEAFNTFKDLFTNSEQRLTRHFFKCLDEEDKELKICAEVRSLLEARKKWLKSRIQLKPVFSWIMSNAKLQNYPFLEKFFKSKDSSLVYEFRNSNELAKFLDSNDWTSKSGFSAEYFKLTERSLEINKNSSLYDEQVDEFMNNLIELNDINEFFLKICEC